MLTSPPANYLEERPLHKDQQLTACDDGSYLLESTAIDTNELRWWLLGFGANIEVLEPDYLRDEFRKIADAMANTYS